MRVAISGTHCCGKSTLIDAFLLAHPDYTHEPEPYTMLEEEYGEIFSAEPSADEFYQQLEFNVDRLRQYKSGDQVIFERCPVDFLAYLLALKELRRGESNTNLIETSVALVLNAVPHLDLIVFLPLNEVDGIEISEDEDPELREAVNARLVDIFNTDEFNLFTSSRPVVLEVRGSTSQRLRMVEEAL